MARTGRRFIAYIILTGLTLSLLAAPAWAKRVALVIGNAAYAGSVSLRNPYNDAHAVTAALRRIGFDLGQSPLLDADNSTLRTAIGAFRKQSDGAEVALVYYAGHAVQINNSNYLLPIDAVLRDPGDVDLQTVALSTVLSQMRGQVNLMILDACRDNPFAQRLTRGSTQLGRSIGTGRGLARIDNQTLTGGALLAMAAAPGSIADDGGGRNSPYTAALLRYLEQPGLEIRLMFASVREMVEHTTGGKQRPEAIDRLPARKVFLNPVQNPLERDVVACERLMTSGSGADARAYLSAFPEGQCRGAAQALARQAADAGAAERQVETDDGGGWLPDWLNVFAYFEGDSAPAAPAERPLAEPVRQVAEASAASLASVAKPVPLAPPPDLSAEEVERRLGLTTAVWRAVQTALNERGHDAGQPDGIPGRRTRAALAAWQRAEARPVVRYGFLTDADRWQLMASPGAGAPASAVPSARARPDAADAWTWRESVTGMDFVWVPGGSYEMGCGSWTGDCDGNEKPVHAVSIGDFWLGKYEVTRGQWARLSGAGGSDGGSGADAHLPLRNVSWDEVQDFIRRLNRLGVGRFRLPSESEWEYACRSGGLREKYAGSVYGDAVGWHRDNAGGRLHPVGEKPANGLGLHDLSGNVWEWVQDRYARDAYGMHANLNPLYEVGGLYRVVRGGSWQAARTQSRCSARYSHPPQARLADVGFRLVRER